MVSRLVSHVLLCAWFAWCLVFVSGIGWLAHWVTVSVSLTPTMEYGKLTTKLTLWTNSPISVGTTNARIPHYYGHASSPRMPGLYHSQGIKMVNDHDGKLLEMQRV